MSRAVVTGGAGFLGSHLVERLLHDGWEVVAIDSLVTGSWSNLPEAATLERVELDVSDPFEVEGPVDIVFHLASIASPVDYVRLPLQTLWAGSLGTHTTLELAERKGAAYFLASTSEVYGDPDVTPQPETYWGNVNPVGPRSMYDESKRYAEAYATAFAAERGLRVQIVRIFNTYGPRMRADDGRAIPTFIRQALTGEALTVHGDGTQTRSLCYVDDLIDGVLAIAGSNVSGPVNLGNPQELTISEIAERVRDMVGSNSEIVFTDRPPDDPERRRPDISVARSIGWEPRTELDEGLRATIAWARDVWSRSVSS